MSYSALLTQRATVQRWTRTVDDYGEATPSWSSVATDVHCLVQQKSGRIAMGAAGREYEFSAIGFFKTGADIKPQSSDGGDGDRVTIGSATYQVRGVGDPSGKAKTLTAYLERV